MNNKERAEQMAQLLEAQAASGQSKKAFCADRGISPAVFYYWQKRLSGEADGAAVPEAAGFVEVKARRPAELELRLPSGQWVGVRAGSPRALGMVLEAIGQGGA